MDFSLLPEAISVQEQAVAAATMGSPNLVVASKKDVPQSLPSGDLSEEVVHTPAAKDLLSLASLNNFSQTSEINRPAVDLVEDDLHMRLSGPSSGLRKEKHSSGASSLVEPIWENVSRNPQPQKRELDTDEVHNSQRRGHKTLKV